MLNKNDDLQLQECQAIGDTPVTFMCVINTVHLIGAINCVERRSSFLQNVGDLVANYTTSHSTYQPPLPSVSEESLL